MSTDNKLQLHANAVNLARRWSVQNENDLMQASNWRAMHTNLSLQRNLFVIDVRDILFGCADGLCSSFLTPFCLLLSFPIPTGRYVR